MSVEESPETPDPQWEWEVSDSPPDSGWTERLSVCRGFWSSRPLFLDELDWVPTAT